jgi:nitrogen regulatory protein P-II 1
MLIVFRFRVTAWHRQCSDTNGGTSAAESSRNAVRTSLNWFRADFLMKKIEAIVRPFKVEEIKAALNKLGVEGMTLSEVRGYGPRKGRREINHTQNGPDFLPKVKIEIVVLNVHADAAFAIVLRSARAGRNGDEKVFVSDVEYVVRISTEERNEAAL